MCTLKFLNTLFNISTNFLPLSIKKCWVKQNATNNQSYYHAYGATHFSDSPPSTYTDQKE